ncbi:uracil-DNA glycosylase family protein [Halorhabdus salina]|uniref:uracil-DNA glycosylase family protein n=1 Tax=Halorhabdus salina TaxID=2750670 RepID=UPI0015EF27A6|nr:uracil-DNA glycosylase family protein [Halorhabdus salina]
MTYVSREESNPFGFRPDCDRFVPGFGDVAADFHVIGDHPGVHGGVSTGIPFTETGGSERLQRALLRGDLLHTTGSTPDVNATYLSYLHPCVPEGTLSEENYRRAATFVESEVRAITAHVLLPVGERATRWVFEHMTTQPTDDIDMDALHATEVLGSGWLVYPTADPDGWSDGDGRKLGEALLALQEQDYRREADLGRLVGGDDPYFVR